MKNYVALSVLLTFVSACSSPQDNSFAKDDIDSPVPLTAAELWEVIDAANTENNWAAENMIAEKRIYQERQGYALTTGTQIKDALANCTFYSGDFFNPTDSYRAAHVVWKKIRDEFGQGSVEVYRHDGFVWSADYQTLEVYSDTCSVAGPKCSVDIHFADGTSLFAVGDSCQ